MVKRSALIDTPVEACCPSVFAAPLDDASALELAQALPLWLIPPGSGSSQSSPPRRGARCACASSSNRSAKLSRQ